jgi:DNA modification methylase
MAQLTGPAFSSLLETGVVYCDDNLHRLPLLPSDSVDLIYLDPPFFSNRYYEVIWGDEAEVRSFGDRWEGGIQHYVAWMKDRVLEMWRVLKPMGSIYLHCDWHASHYLKVMMDEVFGSERFRNEIVWKRTSAHGNASATFGNVTDSILSYSRGEKPVWNQVYVPHSDKQLAKYSYRDPDGRRWQSVHQRNPAVRPNLQFPFTASNGITYHPHPNGWSCDLTRLQRYDRENRLHFPAKPGGTLRLKLYLDESAGTLVSNLWDDIPPLNSQARERLGYPTQKPEALLERLIQVSSNPGDVILDPFAGCGTTSVVAHRLRRKCIGIDISPTACSLMKRRLAKVGALDVKVIGMPATVGDLKGLKPFEFQNWVIDHINGVQSPRKSGDMGIDGWTFMLHDPVQIKQSEGVGRKVVDEFETAIRRDGKARGFVVAFSFGRGSHEEAARARRDGLDIRLVKVDDLLASPEAVLRLMGVSTGLPEPEALPMPQYDPKRHSADELVLSDTAAG